MGYFAAFILLGVALAPTRSNLLAGLILLLAAISATVPYVTATGFVAWLIGVGTIVLAYLGVGCALWMARFISRIGQATP